MDNVWRSIRRGEEEQKKKGGNMLLSSRLDSKTEGTKGPPPLLYKGRFPNVHTSSKMVHRKGNVAKDVGVDDGANRVDLIYFELLDGMTV